MQKHVVTWVLIAVCTMVVTAEAQTRESAEGARWISKYGYDRVIELTNGDITVVLDPNCGGRVLEYSLDGTNALYLDPEHNGWTYEPGEPTINPSGGRCDIGPESIVPRRTLLWLGRWEGEIIGPRAARLTSQVDPSAGVQLVREFRLDGDSTHLVFTQFIHNVSDEVKRYCHWSRTFAEGGGICVVPLTPPSRFPESYILYGPGSVMDYRPDDTTNIRVRDGFLEVYGTPPRPKFGIDSMAGWFGYISRSDMLFVKKFPVHPDRAYGEMAAFTISLWYYEEQMCELEPIGPWETIQPGHWASFTEEWWLFPWDYPDNRMPDLDRLASFVTGEIE